MQNRMRYVYFKKKYFLKYFSLKNIEILHYIVNKQDVSVLPFQKLLKWTPHNEDECFGVFEVFMLSIAL